jgi:predicted XRE-type DNA-binding protein
MNKNLRFKDAVDFAKHFDLSEARAVEGELKAMLIKSIIKEIHRKELTHAEVAGLSGVPRTAITGIVNGSMLKVTIDRLLRIMLAIGLTVELKVKKAS